MSTPDPNNPTCFEEFQDLGKQKQWELYRDMRRERNDITSRQRSDEDQLVRIAHHLGRDARHAPDDDATIAGLVIAEFKRLDRERHRQRVKLKNRAATIQRLLWRGDRLRRDRDRWREAAIQEAAESDQLQRENHRQRVKLRNRAALIWSLWQGMEGARAWLKGELADQLGDPANNRWACLWCGEMLQGREHARQHCHECRDHPLVRRIQELERQLQDPSAPWNNH